MVYRGHTLVVTDTTTLKVQTSTRDLIRELGTARRQTADQVIRDGLAAMRRDELRLVAATRAQATAGDPADLAEIRALHDDIAALHEG